MPYSGASDPNLPSNVQKLTTEQKQKWVATWNATYKNCMDDSKGGGAGAAKNCETMAFRIANGTIKEVEEMEHENEKMLEVEEGMGYPPYGGAQSFEELDKIEAQRDALCEMQVATSKAEGLMSNVMRDPNMKIEEKPNAIQKIMNGLVKRVKKLTGGKDTGAFDEATYVKEMDEVCNETPDQSSIEDISKQILDLHSKGSQEQFIEVMASIDKCAGTEVQKSMLRNRVKRLEEVIKAKALPEVKSSFWITKDKDGNMRWIGFPSNKWRDRDNPPQIISEEAHKEFVSYLEKTNDYPVLLSWHTPGTRLGQADWAEYEKGFLIMGGLIDKDKHAEAERLAIKCQNEAIGMSHGFVYSYADKAKEIIGKYRSWEVSHLPIPYAANVWTSIDIIRKEVKEQMLSEEKKAYLIGLHGEEVVDSIINKAADLEKDLVSAGIEFKDMVEPEVIEKEADPKSVAEAIVEGEGFKALTSAIAGLEESVKQLVEVKIPEIEAKITETQKTAQKSADDIIADAMQSRSSVYQASKEGPEPTEAEKKEGPETEPVPYDQGLFESMTSIPGSPVQSIIAQ